MRRIVAYILILTLCTLTTCRTDSNWAKASIQENLSDPAILHEIEDGVYENLIFALDSNQYFVEAVQACYISQEYLNDLAFNTQANVYFGYTLDEIEELFQGEKYIFTLGTNNETSVEPWENYAYDDTYDRIIRNISVGTGIIALCVTVSLVTTGMPAVSMIFLVAAKTGAIVGLKDAAFSGVLVGILTAIQTGDMNEALKAAAVAGSEGFKWGAIFGAITGGASEYIGLKGASLNGLTLSEAATIQRDSKLPLAFIKNFHSVEEYRIYKLANLKVAKLDSGFAYIRSIDLNRVITDQTGRTMTNAERIVSGFSPVDANGIPYELHHIGQKSISPLAILTKAEHMQGGNNRILHYSGSSTVEHDAKWQKQVTEFWIAYLKWMGL